MLNPFAIRIIVVIKNINELIGCNIIINDNTINITITPNITLVAVFEKSINKTLSDSTCLLPRPVTLVSNEYPKDKHKIKTNIILKYFILIL